MKLLQINTSLNTSSTGKIVNQIGDMCIKNGDESYIMYSGRYSSSISKSITYKIGTRLDFYLHAFITRVFDNHGFASNRATKKMLKNIEIIKPDVIHLHNLHGYYLNVEILFQYLQTSKAKIVWTLHDCWSFTGHCSHFDYVGCVKWMTACNNCPQKTSYPSSLILDNSEMNFENKKKLFNSIDISNMTIVPVSKWLKTKVEKSFLKSFNSRVINNGIDLNEYNEDYYVVIENLIYLKYGEWKTEIITWLNRSWKLTITVFTHPKNNSYPNTRLLGQEAMQFVNCLLQLVIIHT